MTIRVPRYQFVAGQELLFETKTIQKTLGLFFDNSNFDPLTNQPLHQVRSTQEERRLITAWVLEIHADESADILYNIKGIEGDGGKIRYSTFCRFRIFPDGSLHPESLMASRMYCPLFIPLPQTLEMAQEQWKEEEMNGEMAYYVETSPFFRSLLNDPDRGERFDQEQWIFRITREKPIPREPQPPSPWPGEALLFLDNRTGLPVLLEEDSVEDYGHSISRTVLSKINRRDPEWLRRLEAERTEVDCHMQTYWEGCNAADDVEAFHDTWILECDDFLTQKEFIDCIADYARFRRDQTDRCKKSILQDRQQRETFIGKPSPDWSAEDMDGNTHSLTGYSGKYLLLDFWWSGCGPCLQSMPDMNRLVAYYAEYPLVILGVNPEELRERVHKVIEEKALSYPTLYARNVQDVYQVNCAPTFILIDPDGVVREIEHGAGPDHFERMREILDRYLCPSAAQDSTEKL